MSKSPLPEEGGKDLDGKVSDSSGASKDQKLDSKDLESYQDTKSNVKESEKLLETTQHIDKKDIVADNSLVSDDKPSQSIISVDIQKSLPCDTKESVPHGTKQDSKPEATVPPEVLASVVTTAVVNEATLTVSETNGATVTKDSSKVDAVVEQELSKLSDSKSVKTDAKSLATSNGDTKPMPNGDIDHSPICDASSEEISKSGKSDSIKESATSLKQETVASEEQAKKDVDNLEKSKDINDLQIKLEEKVEKIDLGSRNGVPGIITVESITKKETISIESESEKVSESSKQVDLKEESKSGDVCSDAEKVKDSKQESAEKPLESTEEISSISDSKGVIVDDNLTDSAKLQKANLTDSAKIQSVSEPKVTSVEETPAVTKEVTKNDVVTTSAPVVTSDASDDKITKPSDSAKEKESADSKETDTKPADSDKEKESIDSKEKHAKPDDSMKEKESTDSKEMDIKPSDSAKEKESTDTKEKDTKPTDSAKEKETIDSKEKDTKPPTLHEDDKPSLDSSTKLDVKEEKESIDSKEKDTAPPPMPAEIKASSDAPTKADVKEEKESTDLKDKDTKAPSTDAEIKSTSDTSTKSDIKVETKEEESKQKEVDLKKESEQKPEISIEDDKSKSDSKAGVAGAPEKITDISDKDKKDETATQRDVSEISTKISESKVEDIKPEEKKESSEPEKDLKKDKADKSVSEEPAVTEEKKDSQKEPLDLAKETKDKDSTGVSDMPCEETYDMTAMMTSQILTPADLGIEESTEEIEIAESKDTCVDESAISATIVNGKTCDVAVGLDKKKMARVAAADGEEEEVSIFLIKLLLYCFFLIFGRNFKCLVKLMYL